VQQFELDFEGLKRPLDQVGLLKEGGGQPCMQDVTVWLNRILMPRTCSGVFLI
jgi:hypothetical protein